MSSCWRAGKHVESRCQPGLSTLARPACLSPPATSGTLACPPCTPSLPRRLRQRLRCSSCATLWCHCPAPVRRAPAPPSTLLPCAGLSSDFECDTAAGFQWITLDPSLATATEGTDPASGPAVALDSTCSDLNTTGCCTQVGLPDRAPYAPFLLYSAACTAVQHPGTSQWWAAGCAPAAGAGVLSWQSVQLPEFFSLP